MSKTNVADLITQLSYFHPLTPEVVQFFQTHTRILQSKKGDMLLVKGDVCKSIYFIRRGVLRGYIVEQGRDITTWISVENEVVTCIDSLDTQSPCRENVEAIEDCELLAMTGEDLQELYAKHPEFNITGRKLIQQYYRDSENRAFIARLTTAEEKYNLFLENYAHLANRVVLKYIASFLGMTMETLSRTRSKLSSRERREMYP